MKTPEDDKAWVAAIPDEVPHNICEILKAEWPKNPNQFRMYIHELNQIAIRAYRLGQVEAWREAEREGDDVVRDGNNVRLGEEWSWDDAVLEYQARLRAKADAIERRENEQKRI